MDVIRVIRVGKLIPCAGAVRVGRRTHLLSHATANARDHARDTYLLFHEVSHVHDSRIHIRSGGTVLT